MQLIYCSKTVVNNIDGSQSPLVRLAGNILLVASGRGQGGSIIIRGQQPGPGPEAASGAGRPAQLHLTLVMTRDAELSSSLAWPAPESCGGWRVTITRV